jgi:type II secretory pathway predicted ATPase ExeA
MKNTFLEYFSMTKAPFGKDLSRQELFNYPQLLQLEEMIELTVAHRSMLLTTSRAGGGKTTATRACLEALPEKQYKVIYLGQDQGAPSLFARLADSMVCARR